MCVTSKRKKLIYSLLNNETNLSNKDYKTLIYKKRIDDVIVFINSIQKKEHEIILMIDAMKVSQNTTVE